MKTLLFNVSIIACLFTQNIFAEEFKIENEIKKCQKCHGEKFDKTVLNSTRKISTFSENELLTTFESYINAPDGGKKGLMKIIVKKYSQEERKLIVKYIYKKTH